MLSCSNKISVKYFLHKKILPFIRFKTSYLSVSWQFFLLFYHVKSNFAHVTTAELLYWGRDQRVVVLELIVRWLSLVKRFVCRQLYPKDFLIIIFMQVFWLIFLKYLFNGRSFSLCLKGGILNFWSEKFDLSLKKQADWREKIELVIEGNIVWRRGEKEKVSSRWRRVKESRLRVFTLCLNGKQSFYRWEEQISRSTSREHC